jgi:hypothetical protein
MKQKIFLFIIIISLSGCFRSFYQTNTRSSIDTATLSRLISEEKYFIIHFSNCTKALSNAYVKNDSLYGRITTVPREHTSYLSPDNADATLRIKPGTKEHVLAEVHLYTTQELNGNDSVFTESVSSFNRADVYELNKKATNGNHIWSVVGITVGFLALVILTAAAAYGFSAY